MINLSSKIFVAGHNGLVGSAIVRKLKEKKYKTILTISRNKLDLTDQNKVFKFLKKTNQNSYLLLQLKLEEYILMTNIKRNSYMKIYQFKII